MSEPVTPVGEQARNREQIGAALDLVDHHQTAKRGERRHGLVQPGQADGVLQVEVVGGALGQ
jgi:hypothetical protein